ncbi:MAG TPA: hypothetical protein VI583_11500 [Cyclobacteriaceae bacterium]|nr:hypothetical protein [Cyclobacteriaceae bacterium]
MPENSKAYSILTLSEKLESLELRIRNIESILRREGLAPYAMGEDLQDTGALKPRESDNQAIEANVMEYGLAWLSSIVFLLGIIFFMAWIRNRGYAEISSIVGYTAAFSVFLLSFFLRRAFPHMMSLLTICGLLLLYYNTIRLYFFTPEPIIPYRPVVLIMTMSVIAVQVYYAIRKNSEFFAVVSVMLLLLTALINDSAWLTLTIIGIGSVLTLTLYSRFGWWRLMIVGIFFVYFSHLLWLLNNPLMGHPLQAVSGPNSGILHLFGYATAFSLSIVLPVRKPGPAHVSGSISFINLFIFTLLVLLEIGIFYTGNYTWIFGLISIMSLSYSVVLKRKTESIFMPSLYACFGFMSLSGAIYGYATFPDAFLLLTLQSLLVVSLALWYRSKIIVMVNTLLYLSILTAYLVSTPPVNEVNFMFAFVALATARILNWKKERLVLKTDFMRNVYLVSGFIMVLFSLNHALPGHLVTLSWTIAAVFYFIMSVLLGNIKYRYMGIATILLTGIHLLLVDMAKMDIGNRVIAFLFFAAITLGISLYYTKRIKKKTGEIK